MPEDAGSCEVRYIVQSDAAIKHLAQIEKHLEKVANAAGKQEKAVESAYKKMGKAAAAFGAVTIGMLYGIIKASSYADMWMDQIGHSLTRLANAILEITGLKETIEFFVGVLETLADYFEDPEGTDFWAEVAEDFDEMSTKGKIATVVVGVLGAVITALMALALGNWFLGVIASAKAFATVIASSTLITNGLTMAVTILKGAFALIGGTVGLVVIAVVALVAYLGYLWTQTDHGQAQIQSLINIWNNFTNDISEIGWIGAITQAIKDLGVVILFEVMHLLKELVAINVAWAEGMYDFALDAGGKILQYLIDGFESMFGPIIDSFWHIYDNFWEILEDTKTMAYNKAIEIYTWLVDGLTNFLPWVIDSFWYIYDNFWDILEDVKTMAYNKAVEIYTWLVDGLASALGWVAEEFAWVGRLWNAESDAVVIAARHTGEDIMDEASNGVDASAPLLEAATTKAGDRASDGLRDGVAGASSSVCNEMSDAVSCTERRVTEINAALDEIVTDIQIQVQADLDAGNYVASGYGWSLSGWKVGGSEDSGDSGGSSDSGSGGYTASSWSAGWKVGGYATGGHVLRTGLSVVHQGEDIVNLKNLLSGIRSNKAGGGSNITINPTINISPNGKMSDPFEANRVADLISKRMGEELRRITTGI